MIIKKYISSLIQGKCKLYDANGIVINQDVIFNDYNRIKNYLYANFNENDIIGINLTKNYKYLLALLACMEIGITYIPLRKKWPESRVEQIQSISECTIIDDITWEDISTFSSEERDNSFKITSDKTLYIMFTSGTTGVPKGVIIKRESYENFLLWLDEYFNKINDKDRMLFTTDFTFDISLVDIGLLLVKHLNLYISSFENDILQLLFELDKFKITVHSTVPYNYTMMVNSHILHKADISNLKSLILAGSRFPYGLYQFFKESLSYVDVYNAYGPTEATIYVTCHHMNYSNDILDHNISIGQPVNGCNVQIIDNELCISGVQVMQGYVSDEEKTNDVLLNVDGETFYKTGDLAFQDELNNFFVVGRKDDTVKISGFRVNLLDIDAYLHTLDYIKDSATIIVENKKNEDSFLVTFLILTEDKALPEIRSDMKKILLDYQVAKKILILENFPLNNSGKIDRKALQDIYLGRLDAI